MSAPEKIRQTSGKEKNSSGFFNFRGIKQSKVRGGEGRQLLTFDSYTETTLTFYPDRCINCTRCLQVCPHAVFSPGTGTVRLEHPSICMECGACARNCPVQAIEVQNGVGCAWAMIGAALRGKNMDSGECGCGGEGSPCCGER
ncbi:MAG: mercury methylation ferredoxin HgcB [Methanoregula sp.]|jgi:ferredoxin